MTEAPRERRAAAATLAAAAVAYPLVTLWYFWTDWFRFLDARNPMTLERSGLSIPVSETVVTLLSPWRLLGAAAATLLLATAARKVARGAPGGRALGIVTLLGVVLPQVFWYTELAADWRGGEGLLKYVLLGVLGTLLPSALLARGGRAVRSWGDLGRSKGRVLLAASGLGFLTITATTLLDHAYQFGGAGTALSAALLSLPLTALAMVGLFRQKTWGLLAAGSATASLATMFLTLRDATYAPTGRAMDTITSAVTASPVHAAAAAAIPVVGVVALLWPFLAGLARAVAGAPSLAPAEVVTSTGFRIATPSTDVGRTETDADEEAIALEESAERARRRP